MFLVLLFMTSRDADPSQELRGQHFPWAGRAGPAHIGAVFGMLKPNADELMVQNCEDGETISIFMTLIAFLLIHHTLPMSIRHCMYICQFICNRPR